jgi:hypothetical protein
MSDQGESEKDEAASTKDKEVEQHDDMKSSMNNNDNNNITAQEILIHVTSPSPSLTVSLLVFWVLPVLFLAIVSHYVMDTTTPPKPIFRPDRQITIPLNTKDTNSNKDNKKMMMHQKPASAPSRSTLVPKPAPLPTAHSRWPTSYRETIETIQERHRKVPPRMTKPKNMNKKKKKSRSTSSSSPSPTTPVRDPLRKQYEDKIDSYRTDYQVSKQFWSFQFFL